MEYHFWFVAHFSKSTGRAWNKAFLYVNFCVMGVDPELGCVILYTDISWRYLQVLHAVFTDNYSGAA
jgi:hypothetical protein